MTGRSEVDVRYYPNSQVGSSLPADGMHPGLQTLTYHNCCSVGSTPQVCYGCVLRSPLATSSALVVVLFLSLSSVGCLGSCDVFAERRTITGDYFLMQGKSDPHDIFLFVGSGSEGGYLHQIGWDHRYIIYTNQSSPEPWNAIVVKEHREIKITEAERTKDKNFRDIPILSPAEAWAKSNH
jgi:hypothetical protein